MLEISHAAGQEIDITTRKKIKIHSSCEIEYFVKTHLCKLCVILRVLLYNLCRVTDQNFNSSLYQVSGTYMSCYDFQSCVKIRPRKACRYPNLRSFGWVSYDKIGGLYSGKLGIRSEARASDPRRSYPGLWWKRIKLYLYEGTKVSTLRGPAQMADL